jgi:hypothetical protein
MTGETCTRQHVIADRGVNHVEGDILRCGHTAERVRYPAQVART